MSVPWYCPACATFHISGVPIAQTRSADAVCDCGAEALEFAVRVYREQFRTVPLSMSQVRRLDAQGKARGKK